jgi:outer membrane protein TolC
LLPSFFGEAAGQTVAVPQPARSALVDAVQRRRLNDLVDQALNNNASLAGNRRVEQAKPRPRKPVPPSSPK